MITQSGKILSIGIQCPENYSGTLDYCVNLVIDEHISNATQISNAFYRTTDQSIIFFDVSPHGSYLQSIGNHISNNEWFWSIRDKFGKPFKVGIDQIDFNSAEIIYFIPERITEVPV